MPPKTSFSTELEIAAPPDAVWRVLTQPNGRRPWLNDAEVRPTTPGTVLSERAEPPRA